MVDPAQQPELRSFVVYQRLPANCIAVPVTNNDSAPHLRPGDIAVVNTDDRDPGHHELFLAEFGKSSGHPTRRLIETWLQPGRYGKTGSRGFEEGFAWMLGALSRPRSREEMLSRMARGDGMRGGLFCDGPYYTEGPGYDYLVEKMVGRVVGILEPAFDAPIRRIS